MWLPLEDGPPLGTTKIDDVTRARAFVDKRRVVCRCCGEDEKRELRSVHGTIVDGRLELRARHRLWDAPIARLVQAGVDNGRLLEELAKCVTLCQGCHMRHLNAAVPRPKMLRAGQASPIGDVAKGTTTTSCAAKVDLRGGTKRRPITEGKPLVNRMFITRS